MALVVKDRVRQTTTTAGTGTVTLNGTVVGFQSFSVIGDGNTTYYAIVDAATGDWEVGLGTYTLSGTTLSRDTVLESSNSGSLVPFAAGTKDVFCTYPAERSVYADSTTIAVPAANLTVNGVPYASSASALTTGSALTFNGSTLATTGALQVDGNTTLGNASTDTVTVNGYMGIGGAGANTIGLYLTNTISTGNIQYGIAAAPVGNGTNQINGIWSGPATAASSFTAGTVAAIRAANATKGAGSTITNLYGLVVEDQTQGTNNYGITSLVSSGANKWNIYASGTANNYFAGNVGIGGTPAKLLDLAANNTGITTGDPLNTLRFSDTDTTSAAGQPMGRIEWYSADTDTAGVKAYIQAQATDGSPDADMVFATNHVSGGGTAERMRIQYDGNVGIGITSPTSRLQLKGPAGSNPNTNGVVFQYSASTANFGAIGLDDASGDFVIAAGSGASTRFYTNSDLATTNERMRITSAGELLVGTTGTFSWQGVAGGAVQTAETTFNPIISSTFAASTAYPAFVLAKSRSGTVGTYTYPNSGDRLGTLSFAGANTADAQFNSGALIEGLANQTWTSTAQGTYLRFHTTANGTKTADERMRITADGILLVGTTSSQTLAGNTGLIQVETPNAASNISVVRNTADTAPPLLVLGKSKGAALGSRAAVTSGDGLGAIYFNGADGTNMVVGAAIYAEVDGAVSTGVMPTSIQFYTENTAGTFAEKMRITAAGNVGIGTQSPGARLQTNGPGGAPNATGLTTAANASIALSSTGAGTLGTSTMLFGGVGSSSYVWLQGQNTGSNAVADIVLNAVGGNVGIGTTSTAGYKFVVSDGTTSSVVHAGGGASYYGAISNNPVLFITNNTERARITSIGESELKSTTANGAYVRSGSTITLASNATINITSGTAGACLVLVYNAGDGAGAVFFANYLANSVKITGDGAATDTGSTFAVYKNASNHVTTIRNRYATSQTFRIAVYSAEARP